MNELMKENGSVILEALGGVLVIGILAAAFLGGGLAKASQAFSSWLYG